MKRILIQIIVTILIGSTLLSVALADECKTTKYEALSSINPYAKEQFDDFLNGNERSLKKPTKYWSLFNNNQYNARLELVNSSWLYTNYYFRSNANQRLYVRGRVYSNTGRPTVMKIGLYNMKKGKIVATREVTSKLDGQYFEYYFYNLDTKTNYAIAFATVFDGFSYDSVHGNAVIYH